MERPILFSAPMVRAILAGAKTQTRRAVKPQPDALDPEYPSPFGVPGDRLWVREAHATETWDDDGERVIFRADLGAMWRDGLPGDVFFLASDYIPRGGGWRPSIYMPRWASRITLEVVSVRVERAQKISDADIAAEGVTERTAADLGFAPEHVAEVAQHMGPIGLWQMTWEKINGVESWAANPWVWVVGFRLVKG